jgi:hypothetical protein
LRLCSELAWRNQSGLIVLEFALNDNNQTSLQTLVNILQRKYVNAAIVILELASSLHKDVLQLPDGWAAGKDIAREFHLPYVNWSQAMDRRYNTTFCGNQERSTQSSSATIGWP